MLLAVDMQEHLSEFCDFAKGASTMTQSAGLLTPCFLDLSQNICPTLTFYTVIGSLVVYLSVIYRICPLDIPGLVHAVLSPHDGAFRRVHPSTV